MKLSIPLEFPNPMTLLGKLTKLYCIVQLYAATKFIFSFVEKAIGSHMPMMEKLI